jgi:hypothetical protein
MEFFSSVKKVGLVVQERVNTTGYEIDKVWLNKRNSNNE